MVDHLSGLDEDRKIWKRREGENKKKDKYLIG
jgi:hypothetical protein